MLCRIRPLAVLFALIAVFATSNPAWAVDSRLAQVSSFAFALGSNALTPENFARLGSYDLVVVDGEEASIAQIAQLHASGVIVLAYLSVGTIERGRWWYRSVSRYRLDYWDDWGEWYANVSKSAYRKVLTTKVAPWMLAKGFDGLFLDNTDMIRSHRKQRAGMYQLIIDLSRRMHANQRYLFAQNGEDVILPVVLYLDGWNREDVTSTYDFDTESYALVPPPESSAALYAVQLFKAFGLLVTTADYTLEEGDSAALLSIQNSCAVGALPFVSNIELDRIPNQPLSCSN